MHRRERLDLKLLFCMYKLSLECFSHLYQNGQAESLPIFLKRGLFLLPFIKCETQFSQVILHNNIMSTKTMKYSMCSVGAIERRNEH